MGAMASAVRRVGEAVQLLKGASSRWMKETTKKRFAWQAGYGAFTIGTSQEPDTVAYIQSRQEHHFKRDFQRA
jgi:putative transposase